LENYKEISPYSDDEVPGIIRRLKNNQVFLSKFSQFSSPIISSIFPRLGNVLFKLKFSRFFGDSQSIEDFQKNIDPFFSQMINTTTDGFSITGQENLSGKPTVFIGNHRDIALDAAFLNYTLYMKDLKTARIAIGDNLLDKDFAEDLMRLNKSFIVHRNIIGIKETYRKLHRLSSYIYKSITVDLESIWIAQREGRANNGNDSTDIAVLKMLYLSTRKTLELEEWLEKVNLTPVVISYEYDPLDAVKARGWDGREELDKGINNERDIEELITGIRGNKGRVHLHICKPIRSESTSLDQIAEAIDISIQSNYKLWPTNYFSARELSKTNSSYKNLYEDSNKYKELSVFMKRFQNEKRSTTEQILKNYAYPVLNQKKARIKSS
jgi:hypothetical protein